MGELSWAERGRLWFRLAIRLILAVLFVVVIWKIVLPLLGLLAPFVAAFVVAWLLNPLIRLLQRKLKASRGALSLALVILVMIAAGVIVGVLIYFLASQVVSFFQNWQVWWSETEGGINGLTAALEELFRPLPGNTYEQVTGIMEKGVNWLVDVVPRLLGVAAGNVGSFAMSVPTAVIGVVIFLMATYFLSADYPQVRSWAGRKVPQEFRGTLSFVKRVFLEAFGGYLKAQIILSIAVFFILLIGFMVLRQPYALLLAFALGVMDFIPIIGSGTVMVPWAVVDVILGNYMHAVALMVIWGIIAVFRRVAEPKVVGDHTGLSPIVSLLAIYVGMRLAGVAGMVLGPILCMVVLNIVKSGIFKNTQADVRMAVRDISAILKGGGQEPPSEGREAG